ncbi:hypothetical protein [Actinoplanes sp. NPDC051851]|uniref:hypothetical protein n=1 Tax=Actinoplanes sp. NPDC051851 TaxID=3154753 RepID=UPI003426148F
MLAPFVAVIFMLFPAGAAWAHPLDISWQTSYVTVDTGRVTVEVKLSAGVLVAPALIAALDRDGDRVFSAAEGSAYARTVMAKLTLLVDDAAVELSPAGVTLPTYAEAAAGYGTLRITATGVLPSATGDHTLLYRNDFTPAKPRYQATVFTAKNAPVSVGRQTHDEDQQQVQTFFSVRSSAAASSPPTTSEEHSTTRLLPVSATAVIVLLATGLLIRTLARKT